MQPCAMLVHLPILRPSAAGKNEVAQAEPVLGGYFGIPAKHGNGTGVASRFDAGSRVLEPRRSKP
jgi:hypothetical protein